MGHVRVGRDARARAGVVAATVLLLASACSGGDHGSREGASGVAWAKPVGALHLAAAPRMLLPSADPPGLTAARLDRPSGASAAEGWVAVYADAHALRTVTLSLLFEPGIGLGGDIQQAQAPTRAQPAVERFGARWWVWWPAFDIGEEQVQAAVGAEGFSRQEALAISHDLVIDQRSHHIRLAHLRKGLRQVTAGRMDLPGIAALCIQQSFGAATVSWERRATVATSGRATRYLASPRVCLASWKADASTDALLRATVAGRRDVRIRGHAGASGTFAVPVFGSDQTIQIRTWREAGTTVAVTSTGVADATMDRFLATLHPGYAADWRRLETEASTPRVDALDAHRVFLSGQFQGGTWTLLVAKRVIRGEPRVLVSRVVGPYPFGGQSYQGTSVATGLRVGMTTGPRGILLWGLCNRATTKVVLTLADGSTVSPQLIDNAAFGTKVFAMWRPDRRPVVRAISFARDGHPRWQGVLRPPPATSIDSATDLGFIGRPA